MNPINIQKQLFTRYQAELLSAFDLMRKSMDNGGRHPMKNIAGKFNFALKNFIGCIPESNQKRYLEFLIRTSPKTKEPAVEIDFSFLDTFTILYNELLNTDLWELMFETNNKALNLDEKIEIYYDRNKFISDYEACIAMIGTMIEDKVIDSSRIKDDLESLLQTLKVTKNSSFLSQVITTAALKVWIPTLTAAFISMNYDVEKINLLTVNINNIHLELESVTNSVQNSFKQDMANKILTIKDAEKAKRLLIDSSAAEKEIEND